MNAPLGGNSPVDASDPSASDGARRTVAWPLWLLAAPAFVAVWSAWVGLGRLCGFGMVQPLPGIWDGLKLDTSITLPVGVEAYAAYALRVWLTGDCTARAVDFARRSTIAALCLGAAGQIVYHLLAAAEVTHAPWPVTALVSVLPVIVLGFGASLAHLVQQSPARVAEELEPRAEMAEPTSSKPDAPQALPQMCSTKPTPGRRQTARAASAEAASAGDTAARVRSLLVEEPYVTTAAIAFQLNISERTARRHRAAVLKDLDSAEATQHYGAAAAPSEDDRTGTDEEGAAA